MLPFVSAAGALADLIDKDQDFRLIGSGYGFTEGPAWNPVGNYLVFSDIPGDRRWRWSEAKVGPACCSRRTANGSAARVRPLLSHRSIV